ncbi:hypothetical protein A6B44_02720 [Pasteurella skyensis]|nr:hypothetical protein A6B44_02720 [Pasteurella skyensis]
MRNTFNFIGFAMTSVVKFIMAISMIFGGLIWTVYLFSSMPYYYFIVASMFLFLVIAIILYRHNRLINIEFEKKRKEQEKKEKVRYIIIK